MKSFAIIASLTIAAAAADDIILNRMYIATSSSPALVNQWAVVDSPGSRLSWSRDATLASNLTVTSDARYIDRTSNPAGLVLADEDSSPLHAFGAVDPAAKFPRNAVDFFTVSFAEPTRGTPVLPMVNNVVRSVEFRSQTAEKALDVMQICGGEDDVPYYLIVADGYVSECQNVTLRYV